jgi:hypothetical protein
MKTGKTQQTKTKRNGNTGETFPQPRGWSMRWTDAVNRRNGKRANAAVRRRR